MLLKLQGKACGRRASRSILKVATASKSTQKQCAVSRFWCGTNVALVVNSFDRAEAIRLHSNQVTSKPYPRSNVS
jgi:hypothetical protein